MRKAPVPSAAGAAPAEEVRARLCPLTPSLVPGVERIGGANRFEVAVHVSEKTFPTGADVVFLASGSTFPDALSGSAAAGNLGGPVLLVTRDAIPAEVTAELVRLSPARIVILGGTASISAELERSLHYLPAAIGRIPGADRYAVAAEVWKQSFKAPTDAVFVASGEVFPDALSASAAAGGWWAPVLLTGRSGVPDPVLAALRSEPAIEDIVVLGGPATISDHVVAQLSEFGHVTRIQGGDRYAVSAATSAAFFCELTPTVYIASGEVFPDALSGSAAAISVGAPVLLVSRNSIPEGIVSELQRLKPVQIKVLGGQNTVSDAVVAELAKHLRP